MEAETAEEAQAEVVAGANALLLDEFRPASLATFAALLRAQAEAQAGRVSAWSGGVWSRPCEIEALRHYRDRSYFHKSTDDAELLVGSEDAFHLS